MDATRLSRLIIEEISAVDFPASMLDGWLIAKAAATPQGKIPGVTVLKIPGPEMDGFVAVVDSWIEALREKGGDDAVLEALNETFAALGGISKTPALTKSAGVDAGPPPAPSAAVKAHHSASQMRSEDGKFRASLFRRAVPPRFTRDWFTA